MLFDTDVLIWVLRGNTKAVRTIDRDEEPMISVISRMELCQGARDQKEMAVIRSFLRHFETIPLTENIGQRASIYMEEYVLKSSLSVADALIAATAAENSIQLCSGNAKHYRIIAEVKLKGFQP